MKVRVSQDKMHKRFVQVHPEDAAEIRRVYRRMRMFNSRHDCRDEMILHIVRFANIMPTIVGWY